ncbi:TPA: hypothetical protein HA234_02570 [Candidatus Woesearchaeota archaeon]|nr:hypothetical protein [Candidatus Woesearchaeota archaeon]
MLNYHLEQENLFEPHNLDYIARTPHRPLDTISKYVVEALPKKLAAIRADGKPTALVSQLVEETNALTKPFTLSAYRELGEEEQQIASLDVQMLQSAVIHSHGFPGNNLRHAAEVISAYLGRPNILTYGEIIVSNPLRDIRTFTRNAVGHSESSFYALHQLIENEFIALNERLESAQSYLQNCSSTSAVEELIDATDILKGCRTMMGLLQKMPWDHYETFRTYLHAHTGLQGPSGYFSHGVAIMDLRFAGKRLTKEFFTSLDADIKQGYYPDDEKVKVALELARRDKSLVDLALKKDDPLLSRSIRNFAQAVLEFRGAHHAVVKTVVPDLLQDKRASTRGETMPSRILNGRIQVYQKILENLVPLST